MLPCIEQVITVIVKAKFIIWTKVNSSFSDKKNCYISLSLSLQGSCICILTEPNFTKSKINCVLLMDIFGTSMNEANVGKNPDPYMDLPRIICNHYFSLDVFVIICRTKSTRQNMRIKQIQTPATCSPFQASVR